MCPLPCYKARLIGPLQEVSRLKTSLTVPRSRSGVTTTTYFGQFPVIGGADRTSHRSGSDSTHAPEGSSNDSRGRLSPGQASTTTANSNGSRTVGGLKSSFSACGEDLLLWHMRHDRFAVLSMLSEDLDMLFELQRDAELDLRFVAGGTSTFAALAKTGNVGLAIFPFDAES